MNKLAAHIHTSETPHFHHLFDIPVLFVFAPKGLVLSSKFATSLLLSCVVIRLVPLHAHQSVFLISMTLVFVSCWQRKTGCFIAELLSGLRRFVGALLTWLEPGEHIAQIFSMQKPHNRSDLLHKRTIKMWRRLWGCQKPLLILLASLFELHFASNIHRDRGLTWGEERLSAAERIWLLPSCIHLLKPSLIEEILLTAQSTSAHYALMICPLLQSVDTNVFAQNTVTQVHKNYFSLASLWTGEQEWAKKLFQRRQKFSSFLLMVVRQNM